jgi:hypothetical protein
VPFSKLRLRRLDLGFEPRSIIKIFLDITGKRAFSRDFRKFAGLHIDFKPTAQFAQITPKSVQPWRELLGLVAGNEASQFLPDVAEAACVLLPSSCRRARRRKTFNLSGL